MIELTKSENHPDKSVEIDKYLAQVSKPQRYIDSELNLAQKKWESIKVRLCLAFPDTYEIGMSYFGFQILYAVVNKESNYLAERTYAPWLDLEAIMRRENIPLFAWESRHPIKDFDIIGFTLPHELNYTNILNMLDLAGLAVEAERRTELFPLVIGGGECALSPEPLSPFFDAFVLGDGERIILEILKVVAESKQERNLQKRELLARLQTLDGVYVPQFYDFEYYSDGRIKNFFVKDDAPSEVRTKQKFKRVVVSLQEVTEVKCPLVPLMNIVQERAVVEVRRGCTAGCRFCRAGMVNRPVRERSAEQVLHLADNSLEATGYEEISLFSLNTVDYSELKTVLDKLDKIYGAGGVSIDLPSLRITGFDIDTAKQIAKVRKSGLTFAPEVGTERLSRIINKPWNRESFLKIIDEVLRHGWRTIKLYFMIGLPTETNEDLDGIIYLIKTIEKKGKAVYGRKFKLNVTLSPFVPKPHTPFQWESQPSMEDLKQRLSYIVTRIKSQVVASKEANVEQSYLEAILSRGDRRLGAVIKSAWQKGAKFDNWNECFNLAHWMAAFEEARLEPQWYANRQRKLDEILPWNHIDCRVKRSFLETEWQKSRKGELTPDCAIDKTCSGCGVCLDNISNELAERIELDKAEKAEKSLSLVGVLPAFRLRLFYTKKERLRFLGHLDLTKLLLLLFRRVKLPLSYSSGYTPRARIQFAPPLPVGFEGEEEIVDVLLIEPVDFPLVRDALNEIAPAGLKFLRLQQIDLQKQSIEAAAASAEYLVILPGDKFSPLVEKKSGLKGLLKYSVEERSEEILLRLIVSLKPGEYTNPLAILSQLLEREITLPDVKYIARLKIFLND